MLGLLTMGCAPKMAPVLNQGQVCNAQKMENWRYSLNEFERDEGGGATDCFSISKAAIDHTIKKHVNEIRDCAEQRIAHCPGQKRFSVRMVIDNQGVVSHSTIVSGSHFDSRLMQCVAEKTQSWVFPKPKYSKSYAFVYPFLME